MGRNYFTGVNVTVLRGSRGGVVGGLGGAGAGGVGLRGRRRRRRSRGGFTAHRSRRYGGDSRAATGSVTVARRFGFSGLVEAEERLHGTDDALPLAAAGGYGAVHPSGTAHASGIFGNPARRIVSAGIARRWLEGLDRSSGRGRSTSSIGRCGGWLMRSRTF